MKRKKLHHKATGRWFLDGGQFAKWKCEPGTLWITGKCGTGKTVLSSVVIEELFDAKQRAGTAVAFFYFDFRDNKKQLVETMLRAIILQLSAQSLNRYDALHHQYQVSSGQTLPTYQRLLEVLDELLLGFEATYIVLDALDECREDDLLLQLISRLRQRTTTSLHILFTSQPREFYANAFSDVTHVALEVESTAHDITLFVLHELRTKRCLAHVAQRAEEIASKVVKKSNGMFRLAACLLHELSRIKINPDLDMILASLPDDLFGVYSRFLKPIGRTDFVYVARVLRWLVYALRPLSLLELEDALAFTYSDPVHVYDPNKRGGCAAAACKLLEGLVSVSPGRRKSSEIVTLAHASVADYLVSDDFTREHEYDFTPGPSDTFLAQTCIGHLLHVVDCFTDTVSLLSNCPLAEYAAQYWGFHLLCCDSRPLLLSSVMRLLESRFEPPLILCAGLGFTEGVQFLLENSAIQGVDADSTSREGHHPGVELQKLRIHQRRTALEALRLACAEGQTAVVQLLLDHGVTDPGIGRALRNAFERGHEETVCLLLENGVADWEE
ncbi:hypothetical protein DFH06DRAFT_1056335, partial [Mycena polygramma]